MRRCCSVNFVTFFPCCLWKLKLYFQSGNRVSWIVPKIDELRISDVRSQDVHGCSQGRCTLCLVTTWDSGEKQVDCVGVQDTALRWPLLLCWWCGVAQLLSLTSHWSWWHHSSTPQHCVQLSSCLSSIGPALLLLTTQWLLVTLPEAQSTGSILIAEDLYTNPNKPKKINWIKQNNAWHFVSISGLTGLGLWLISSHFCHYSKVQ